MIHFVGKQMLSGTDEAVSGINREKIDAMKEIMVKGAVFVPALCLGGVLLFPGKRKNG